MIVEPSMTFVVHCNGCIFLGNKSLGFEGTEEYTQGKFVTMRLLESDSGLTVRSQTIPNQNLSNYSPENTRSWIADLPRANIGETAKQIYTRLCTSNKQSIKPELRSGLLMAMQPEIERLHHNLEAHYLKSSISLTTKQKKISELTRALLNEQALGFKAIVDYYISNPDNAKSKKLLGSSLAYGVYYISRLIGSCYQLYLSPPSSLWKELHQLFNIALENNLDNWKIEIPKPEILVSLKTIYKSSLLLAMSHPNELRIKDFWTIQFGSLDFAKKIRLSKKFDDSIEYVVNLNSAAAPFHRSLMTKELSNKHLGINVQPLLFYLQTQIGNTTTEKKSSLSPNLVRHLITAIGNMATRAFSRIPSTDSIEVAIGLAATHALIEKGSILADSDLDTSNDALTALAGSLKNVQVLDTEDTMQRAPDAVANKPPDSFDKIYLPKAPPAHQEQEQPLKTPPKLSGALPKDYRLVPAAVLDISPGGYRLKLAGELPKQTQTDEIIGLLESDEEGGHQWNIGIIRWIQRTSTSELSAGIQLISPNAKPIFTRIKTTAKTTNTDHRSLLLPSLPHIGQPATIITPTLPYEVGKIIISNNNGKISEIKLHELLQAGRSYSRYTFKELKSKSNNSKPDTINPPTTEDFSGVWEIL